MKMKIIKGISISNKVLEYNFTVVTIHIKLDKLLSSTLQISFMFEKFHK